MMGITLDKVVVRLGDSAFPVSAGSGGQWGARTRPPGVYAACMKLREAVAQSFGFNAADAVFSDGDSAIGNRSVPLAEAASDGRACRGRLIEYGDLAKSTSNRPSRPTSSKSGVDDSDRRGSGSAYARGVRELGASSIPNPRGAR